MVERDLFTEALQRPDPAEWAAYLDQACAGDAALRRRVEILLKADAEASVILKESAPPGSDNAGPDLASPAIAAAVASRPDRAISVPIGECSRYEWLRSTGHASPRDPHATENFAEEPGSDPGTGMNPPFPDEDFEESHPFGMTPVSRFRSLDLPRVPEFELLAELGHGGMGVVYKARHRPLNRIVALKMISDGKHASPEAHERFLIEAEAVARLRHPNIVQIYDFGEADGCPFVTLELLEGGSLADRLKGTTQPARAAAELVETLAVAMHAAHQAGIVHRDLKPSNILFDAQGIPKIVDFGIAKRLEIEEGRTLTGQIIGTPSYMAPEQARGEVRTLGPAADIFALGAILYEMLIGRPPFKGASRMETLHQVVYDEAMPPSRLQAWVARDLETICLKCLQKEPSQRYTTALELADDLRRFLDNRPIRARRTPRWERGAKWVRRHPTTATLIGLGTTAVVVLVMAYGIHEVRQRARRQHEAEQVAQQCAKSERDLEKAQRSLLEKHWSDGRYTLGTVLNELGTDRRYADLKGQARRMFEQADRELQDEAARSRDRRQQRLFFKRHHEALLQETRFTGLDLPADVQATRAAARAALAVFADSGPGDAWTFVPLPLTFAPQEQTEIRDGCYELLLVLGEAVAQALPGEDPVLQADRGLKILDQAPVLRSQPTPTLHRARAACFARMRDETRAARERAAADRLHPTTVLDHYLAGREAYKRQDWKTALSEFETVLRIQPDHFWTLCLGAIAALQTNQPAVAKLGLNACVKQEPKFAWLYMLRGFASGQAAVEARVASKTRAIADGSINRAAEVQFETAEEDYRKALELLGETPNNELHSVAMVNRALMRFQRGRWDEAVADLEEAIRLDGRQYLAFAGLGQVLQRQKKWDEAVARFTQAIGLKPEWSPLYRGRAAVEQERDDQAPEHRTKALADLERAIQYEKPGNLVLASDHTGRGELLRRNGGFEDALAACDAALTIAPDYARAHRLRVKILLELNRPGEVIRACDGALARGKPWPGIYEVRGLARASQGDYTGAIDDYSHAPALGPGQSRVLSARGLAYLLSDFPRAALGDFDEAIRLDPANGEAHSGRGLALVLRGDYGAATAEAEESLRLDAPSARRAYNAARIYAQAALAAAADVATGGGLDGTLIERYQDRAVALVELAVERTPTERRAALRQDQVDADPALRLLRPRLRSLQPAEGSIRNAMSGTESTDGAIR